jgi:hypothetical protein
VTQVRQFFHRQLIHISLHLPHMYSQHPNVCLTKRDLDRKKACSVVVDGHDYALTRGVQGCPRHLVMEPAHYFPCLKRVTASLSSSLRNLLLIWLWQPISSVPTHSRGSSMVRDVAAVPHPQQPPPLTRCHRHYQSTAAPPPLSGGSHATAVARLALLPWSQ